MYEFDGVGVQDPSLGYGSFRKLGGTLGVLMIRILLFWGTILGSPIFGNFHIGCWVLDTGKKSAGLRPQPSTL